MCLFHRRVAEVRGKLGVWYIIFQVTYVHATIDEQFSQWCTCGCCIPTFSKPIQTNSSDLVQQYWESGWESNGILKITGVEVSRLWVIESNGWLKFQRVLFFYFFCWWVFRVFSSLIHFTVTKDKNTSYYLCRFFRLEPMSPQQWGPKSWKMQGFSPRCSCFTYPNIFPIFLGGITGFPNLQTRFLLVA